MKQAAQKEFSRKEYWDERYRQERLERDQGGTANYEWLKTFEKLVPFLAKHLPSASVRPRILHLGCGTSSLTTDLHSLGYDDQLSIDFSSLAIAEMQRQCASLGLEWEVMDVREMRIKDASIDVAIDKSTLDAMLHGSLWNPEDEVKQNVAAYVSEVARVLKPGGLWLCVTYRQPHFLKPLLAKPGTWDLEVETVADDDPGAFEYFGFTMTKNEA